MGHESTTCPRCGNHNADQYKAPLNPDGTSPANALHIWCGQCLFHDVLEATPAPQPVLAAQPRAAALLPAT